jgi:transposase
MLADELDYVVGVDTHRDRHVLAVVVAPTGGVVAQRSVRASARGYAEAVRFANKHAPGIRVWAVEGAGHYGAGLARHLSHRAEAVLESGRGPRGERRLRGKDDPLDAVRAARTALASDKLTLPRSGQRREALRLLLVARRGAVEVRRRALVQLRCVIVTAPDRLRDELQTLPERRLLERCSRFRRSSSCPVDELAAKLVLRTLAQRIEAATAEAEQLEREIVAHVRTLAPQLLDEPGVGPIVAADVSSPGHTGIVSARKRPSHDSPASHPSRPQAARRSGTDSAAAATANSTALCTRSSFIAANTTRQRRLTSSDVSPRARVAAKRRDYSSATSPATSTAYCNKRSR